MLFTKICYQCQYKYRGMGVFVSLLYLYEVNVIIYCHFLFCAMLYCLKQRVSFSILF